MVPRGKLPDCEFSGLPEHGLSVEKITISMIETVRTLVLPL